MFILSMLWNSIKCTIFMPLFNGHLDLPGDAIMGIDVDVADALAFGCDLAAGAYCGYLAI